VPVTTERIQREKDWRMTKQGKAAVPKTGHYKNRREAAPFAEP
jgi:hypothetical protein